MNIRRHEAWKRLNGGPKGTEILRIASPGLDLRRPGESENFMRGLQGTKARKLNETLIKHNEK